MKRKVFTSLAAAGILVCTITTASAAPAPACPQQPVRYCFWQNPCCEIQLPDKPEQEETPVLPEAPEQNQIMSALEQAACDLVNQQRIANGLSPLTIDADLSVKARIKSQDMKTNNYFSHNSPTYGSPFQMMKQLGISYRSAGENIAMSYRTAQAVVNAWMSSASHRANILSDQYTTMGIGYVDGYWTQWFIR